MSIMKKMRKPNSVENMVKSVYNFTLCYQCFCSAKAYGFAMRNQGVSVLSFLQWKKQFHCHFIHVPFVILVTMLNNKNSNKKSAFVGGNNQSYWYAKRKRSFCENLRINYTGRKFSDDVKYNKSHFICV